MADIEQKVLTTPTFIHGQLLPAGAIVNIDPDAFPDENGNPAGDEAFPNMGDFGAAPVLYPTEVAAIGPTGPSPRMPQTVPPGSMQMNDGYANGDALLVAQGHPDIEEMQKGADELNSGVEEEAVQRLGSTAQDAGTAGTNGTETSTNPQPFDATSHVSGSVGDTDFSGLTAEQLDAAKAAETAGQNRTTMLAKIEAARAGL